MTWARTGLLGQFAVLSLVVMVSLGVSLGWVLGRVVERNALEEAAAEAADILSLRVMRYLTPEDLRQPMTGQRYDDFLRFVRQSVISTRTARVKLWGRDGTVIFSDEASLVGQSFPVHGDLATALEGTVTTEVSHLGEEENAFEREHGRLLEVHVPILFPGSADVQGAFESYQYYEPVAHHIEANQRALYGGLALGLLLLYGALFTVVKRGHDTIVHQQSRLASMLQEARHLADHDPMTGLLNHRALHQRLDEEIKRAQRGGHELSVVMMDLDGFKLFNDTYGHPAGDRLLREVAGVLLQTARATDVLGRYGGDEFVALLPETGTAGARAVAERFRIAVAEHPYVHQGERAVPIQMSSGITTFPQDARGSDDLMSFADANLYTSKQKGGNTITSADPDASGGDKARVGTFGVLDGLITAVNNKDQYTRQHSESVTHYALSIARALGLSEESQRTLRIAGLLHDVGKIGVPDRILRKPGQLDEEELAIIKQHATLGELIIKDVPNLLDITAAVGSHHERIDGRGYPRGLRGSQIPLLGRVLAVADAYSAMTTDRPYRKALSPQEAQTELLRVAGSQLDPELVQMFVRVVPAETPAAEMAS